MVRWFRQVAAGRFRYTPRPFAPGRSVVTLDPTIKLRNIAIIAHVDHGKTTLVDQLLKQSGTLDARKVTPDRVMDSNALERERGITILAKNTAIRWNDFRINIVDTPGHADFGGEVERVLSMVDSVLLLVDAVDGPMPQTRFVTQKAFAHGLRPIVVINKIDRHEARPNWVLDQTFDLFDRLGATEAQLDFPVVYTSAIQGYASHDPGHRGGDMTALFEDIVKHCPPPDVELNGLLQLQVSQLDYSSYVGAIGIGRIKRGTIRRGMNVTVVDRQGRARNEKILQVLGFLGLERIEVEEASAGDIVAFAGIERPAISDTLCDPAQPEAMPPLVVDEPTIGMTFEVNTSPFAGKRRQVPDQPPDPRAADARGADQRRAAGRGDRMIRTSSRSMGAANCTSACCSRTCGARAMRSRCRGRASSSRKSTVYSTSRTRYWRWTSRIRRRAR